MLTGRQKYHKNNRIHPKTPQWLIKNEAFDRYGVSQDNFEKFSCLLKI